MSRLPPGRDCLIRARDAVWHRLATGDPSIEGVARALETNVRTLQRRLAAAGTSHSRVLAEVRLKVAIDLLEDRRLTLAEISSRLGYSDPAHFTRAFTRWTGRTPRDYRQDRAAKHPDNSRTTPHG